MRSAIARLHHQNANLKNAFSTLTFDNQYHNIYLIGSVSHINIRHSESQPSTRLRSNPMVTSSRAYSSATRLAEVGRFETKQADDDCYSPGQPFLHQIFGYRGVILFPWLARVHDIDVRKQLKQTQHEVKNGTNPNESQRKPSIKARKDEGNQVDNNNTDHGFKNISNPNNDNNINNNPSAKNQSKQYHCNPMMSIDSTIPPSRMNANSTKFHPYYQVLIDTRDCPFVSNRTQTEAVTFLGHPDNSKSVYSIKGLDYVAHEDILPYTSYEETPIHHELHGKLFKFNQDSGNRTRYSATELLESWQSKHPWLELSRVYRETTEDIRVTVIPFYLGHTTIEDISFHWWRYCVRLENFSDLSVQLRERHWKIFSQTTMLQTIKGRGVVGVEPILTKNEPAYQYSSHVNLQDKSGHMWGTFKMQREDGYSFECRIPPFSLESSIDPITPPSSKRD